MEHKFLCPVCRNPLTNEGENFICSSGHKYSFEEDVLVLLDPVKKKLINTYIKKYFEYKKNDGELNIITANHQQLPFVNDMHGSKEWEFRKYSLEIVNKLTTGINIQTVLEF